MAKLIIVYHSRSGNTRKMAEFIKEGANAINGVDVQLKKVKDTTPADLLSSDGIIIGSPTYYGIMATEVKDLMDKSVKYHGKLNGKVGGAFASSGSLGGGNETTVFSILQGLLIHGMIIQGIKDGSHYGPVAIRAPDTGAQEKCIQYGKLVAELTLKLFS